MKVLFLDDSWDRLTAFRGTPTAKIVTWAETAARAIELLESDVAFDLIMLDHDLTEEHYAAQSSGGVADDSDATTGYFVAQWIAERADRFAHTPIIVHSLNAPASERMVRVLVDAGLDAHHAPFAWLKVGEVPQ